MKFRKIFSLSIMLAASSFLFGAMADVQPENEIPADTIGSTMDFESLGEHKNDVLKVALVLNDIYGNRDNEFSRGLLLGLKDAPIPESSLHLKMINGQMPLDSLNATLAEFEPGVIFSTHEKEMPDALLQYANENNIKLLSVFDAKGEDYKSNANVFQLLSPSESFNANSARYINENYLGNILLLVGEPDPSDLILTDMVMAWPEDLIEVIDFAGLQEFSPLEGLNYIIYPILPSDKDLQEFMTNVKTMAGDNPFSGIRVVGRPNWVAIPELEKKIDGVEVLLPSKCYFDKTSDDAKRFIVDYKNKYNHTPMISYPVYAVMGYDVANYLVPALIGELRETEPEWQTRDMLQSYFNFWDDNQTRLNYNNGSYILHFVPGRKLQKELVD